MVDISILNGIIDNWHTRSTGKEFREFNEFDKFIALWIAFNAWGSHETNIEIDAQMIKQLQTNSKMIKSYEKSKENKRFLKNLSDLASEKIPDHRKNKMVYLDSEKSLGSVLDVIYLIRCNLFHGRKDPNIDEDTRLVRTARIILSIMFDQLKASNDFIRNA